MSKIIVRFFGFLALALAYSGPVDAQQPARSPNLASGDAVVTGFSGTLTQPNQAGKSAADLTFINPDGPSARIVSLGRPGFTWDGRLWAAPKTFDVFAKDVGQVFGVALDNQNPPNVYLTATSAFGLQIVGRGRSGQLERRKKGAPGAGWMTGQFGLALQGGPGSIYKVDGGTGAVSLFANVELDGVPNPGPALGNIAYDSAHKQLFVSDLYTGVIHRFALDGRDLGPPYDHGATAAPTAGNAPPTPFNPRNRPNIANERFDTENPDSWGFAPPARRVWGLVVQAGRLYYSARNGQPANGPQIWSVGIQPDGGFAADARWELDVPAQPGPYPVSDIAFTQQGAMILAQRAPIAGAYDYSAFTKRGEPRVLRYRLEQPDDPGTPSRWIAAPEEYAVGFAGNYRNANGGVALGYGYGQDGTLSAAACEATLWTTAQHMRNAPPLQDRLLPGGPLVVHGIHGVPADAVRSANEPPWLSYSVDYDDKFDDPGKSGHLGSVRIYATPCPAPVAAVSGRPASATSPPYVSGPTTTPPGGGGCVGPDCYPPPPSPPIDLAIKKTAGEVKFDEKTLTWTFTFTLTVTNVGAPFSPGGFINIGDPIPAGLTVTGATGPGWSPCTGNLLCGYNYGSGVFNTGATLPPLTITVTSKTPGKYENCATVGLPSSSGLQETTLANNKDCTTVELKYPPNHIKVEKVNLDPSCTVELLCRFQIKVTNLDPWPFSGPVTIADNTTIPMLIASTDVPCAPTSIPFTCTTPLTIGPSGTVTFFVNGVIPAGSVPLTGVHPDPKNCATISNPPPGTIIVIPQDCKPYQVPCGYACHMTDPQIAQIKIEKKADQAQCSPGGLCSFTYTITNTGTAPTSFPITFIGTMPAGAANYVSVTAPPWGCIPFGAGQIKCLYPPPIGGGLPIPPTGSISATVTYQIAPGYNQPTLQNCADFFVGQSAVTAAAVSRRATERMNANELRAYLQMRGVAALASTPVVPGPDDHSCATVNIVQPVGAGTLIVQKKVVNKTPVPLPPTTTYAMTVTCGGFTPSPSTFNLTDGGSQTIGNIPLGTACTVQEGTLTAPAGACAAFGTAAHWTTTYNPTSTTATITSSPITVTVINTLDCIDFPPAIPRCAAPMVPGATPGVCICPPGTVQKGRECVRQITCIAPMVLTAAGTECACPPGTVQRGRECVRPPTCNPPMIPGPVAGVCICPPGTVQKGRECVRQIVCTSPMVPNARGTACTCPTGTVQRGRECVRRIECNAPARPNSAGTACVCPPGMAAEGKGCVQRERPRQPNVLPNIGPRDFPRGQPGGPRNERPGADGPGGFGGPGGQPGRR